MKLLFDENLSPRLPSLLATFFPESMHVRDCGLLGLTDDDLWEFAGSNGYIVISKDSDFQQRSLLFGHPPKVVWLRLGNCTRQELFELIVGHQVDIHAFSIDPFESVLIIS